MIDLLATIHGKGKAMLPKWIQNSATEHRTPLTGMAVNLSWAIHTGNVLR